VEVLHLRENNFIGSIPQSLGKIGRRGEGEEGEGEGGWTMLWWRLMVEVVVSVGEGEEKKEKGLDRAVVVWHG